MISLREIEHEFHPDGGNLGRGQLVSKAEADAVDASGYTPFVSGAHGTDFPVYGADGSPGFLTWRGFIRQEGGKHYCAAIEFYPL